MNENQAGTRYFGDIHCVWLCLLLTKEKKQTLRDPSIRVLLLSKKYESIKLHQRGLILLISKDSYIEIVPDFILKPECEKGAQYIYYLISCFLII